MFELPGGVWIVGLKVYGDVEFRVHGPGFQGCSVLYMSLTGLHITVAASRCREDLAGVVATAALSFSNQVGNYRFLRRQKG